MKTLFEFFSTIEILIRSTKHAGFFLLLSMALSLIPACAPIPDHAGQLVQQSRNGIPYLEAADLKEHDFIDIFKSPEKFGQKNEHGVYIVSSAATAYIKSCCKSRSDAIALLEKNGFKVFTGGKYDPKKNAAAIPYDEEIYGERKGNYFLYTWKTYQISLFIKGGIVDSTSANSFSDAL